MNALVPSCLVAKALQLSSTTFPFCIAFSGSPFWPLSFAFYIKGDHLINPDPRIRTGRIHSETGSGSNAFTPRYVSWYSWLTSSFAGRLLASGHGFTYPQIIALLALFAGSRHAEERLCATACQGLCQTVIKLDALDWLMKSPLPHKS